MLSPDKWTREDIETLIRQWNDKIPTIDIARSLGNRTKNSVISKANRLHLEPRATGRPRVIVHSILPPGVVSLAGSPLHSYPAQIEMAQDQDNVKTLIPEGSSARRLPDLARWQCRWPLWPDTPTPPDQKFFCGKEQWGNGPYCEEHTNRATRNALN